MTPTVGPFATDIYNEVISLAAADEANGWALLHYLDALGSSLFDEIEGYARDSADGDPGWSILLDLNRAPNIGLQWLGQFVGVKVPLVVLDAYARQLIRNKHGFSRGTPAAIIDAAQTTLTGLQEVLMQERYTGDAYQLWVATRTSQTPDSAKTLAAIMTEKPAGIVLTYTTLAGESFDELLALGTFQTVFTTYATMQGVYTGVPGT
jgi:hypothetical protein